MSALRGRPFGRGSGSRDQRGVTLFELAVVFVLATLVMAGLVGFYLSSQATWIDGSTQAQAQRELTLLIETLGDSIRTASTALVTDTPDAQHQRLSLYRLDPNQPFFEFWWSDVDSSVHAGVQGSDSGPLTAAHITRIQWATLDSTMVALRLVEARTPQGQFVQSATRFNLYGR